MDHSGAYEVDVAMRPGDAVIYDPSVPGFRARRREEKCLESTSLEALQKMYSKTVVDGTPDPDTRFANSIVDNWIRISCKECHGTGFADEGRPCEHP